MEIHNIELKLRLDQADSTRSRVAASADGPPRLLQQRDTYFATAPGGYLKLREENGRACLIAYRRALADTPAPSDIRLVEIAAPEAVATALGHALGIVQVVEKTRELYFRGQTRIHVDRVAGLGDFLELEVVLRPGQSEADGRRIAAELIDRLGLNDAPREHRSYRDLAAALHAGP